MTTLTEEEYLKSKMTLFDYICRYSWTPTVLCFFIAVFLAMFGKEEPGYGPVAVFLVLFANTIIMTTILADKIAKWKEEYKRLS